MKKVLLSLLFLAATLPSWAQVNVMARVNKTALTLDDELTLSVEVSGASGNMLMPQLPSLPAFNVYSREVEQATINGQTSTVFRYTMLPRFVGKATIGEISLKYDGKTYKTEPISIRIYRNASSVSNAQPAHSSARMATSGNYDSASAVRHTKQTADPNLPPLERDLANQAYAHGEDNFFLVAAVSNRAPYVNQTFTLAVRFYYNRSFYDAPYQKPSVTNIFMEDAGNSQGTQNIGGQLYRYEEQRYYLTGAAPGAASIGPASVRYMTGNNSALSAFDRLFGGSAVSAEETALSNSISLTVRALPSAGKPQSFYGAVGDGYTISAVTDRTQVEAGEAINLTVTVKGPGNLKPTSDLVWPTLDGFKDYPSAPTSGAIPGAGNTLRGFKVFKTTLVPSASGIYAVPAIKWSYFSPTQNAYQTIQTTPVTLKVLPSTKAENAFDFGSADPTGNGFQALGKDIAYLKKSYAPEQTALAKMSAWNFLNGLMLALLAVCVLFASVGRKSLAHKRAFTTAKNKLKKATKVDQVADAMSDYLQEKLKIRTGSLPLKEIRSALHSKGITPATEEAFALLWQRLDAARFAPGELGTQSARELALQAQDILKLVENETK